ncbi:unnamed protein product [marine sediment metagenome]|uniref:Uncharacterized protein n=1 Tax=marine sediment metagenome TaxID=412755 RepID=X1CMG5_9ZZZZ
MVVYTVLGFEIFPFFYYRINLMILKRISRLYIYLFERNLKIYKIL